MRILISSEVTIYDPTDAVIFYCMDNFTVKNPEFERRLRRGLWLGNTPEYLDLYKKRGDRLIIPYGAYQGLWQYLMRIGEQNLSIKHDLAVSDWLDYQAEIPLYDYQEIAIKAMLQKRYGILQAPAGSGKTQMGIAMIILSPEGAVAHPHQGPADPILQSGCPVCRREAAGKNL